MQFLKYVLATIVGIFLFMVISFALMMGIGSAFSGGDQVETVKENSVLRLNLDANFVEITPAEDSFSELIGDGTAGIGMNDLRKVIKNAALDPNIKGICLDLNDPNLGFAQLEETISLLKDFKKSGKFIYSYSDYMSEKAVLIASVVDSSFMNPVGSSEFNGLASTVTFFKGALDKLGVEPIIFRVGAFKSAVEPFMRTNMSEESRQQVSEYLGSISNHIYTEYANNKKTSKENVDQILNKASMFGAQETVDNKLVSKLAYKDEYEVAIRKKLGINESSKISFKSLNSYKKAKSYLTEGQRDNRIAVLVWEGEIVQGKAKNGEIGSDDFVKEIRKARKDKKIKAIVLRINSPGGSALASDIMWREIQLTRKEKPVIASMGDVAASGGYYMAMGCDTIVAHSTTITGSIGIFGMYLNYEKLLKEKVGLTFEDVKTHQYANSPSAVRKMSDVEKQTIQNIINEGYETFTTKAAQGRKMPLDELKALAGGRVWTGSQAKEHKLVDVLGDLNTAVEIAAQKANIASDAYQVRYYPYPKSEIDKLLEKFSKTTSDDVVIEKLGQFGPLYKQLRSIESMDPMQARMMFNIDIK